MFCRGMTLGITVGIYLASSLASADPDVCSVGGCTGSSTLDPPVSDEASLFQVAPVASNITSNVSLVAVARRQCEFRLPTKLTVHAPIVILVHGWNANHTFFWKRLPANISDVLGGAVVAFPSALPNSLGELAWKSGRRATRPPDVQGYDPLTNNQEPHTVAEVNADIHYLTHTVIQEARAHILKVKKTTNWTPHRKLVGGYSNGADMANMVALNGSVHALMPIAGALFKDAVAKARNYYPISVCAIHGTADQVNLYDGNFSDNTAYGPIEEAMTYWADVNGLQQAPEEFQLSGNLTLKTWHNSGADFPRVELNKMWNHSHTFPNITSAGFDPMATMISFFSRYIAYYKHNRGASSV